MSPAIQQNVWLVLARGSIGKVMRGKPSPEPEPLRRLRLTQNYVHVDEAMRLAVERVSAKIDNLMKGTEVVVLDLAA